MDEVDDGFCLREIHAAVEEGALCELARPGLPGACGEEQLQRAPEHDGRAVALELGGVLAGIAVRAAEKNSHAVVYFLPAVHKAAILQHAGG